MILGFKKNFPWGEPTYFKEKILASVAPIVGVHLGEFMDLIKGEKSPEDFMFQKKIHTIRRDYADRWQKGRSIQMCYRGKGYSMVDEFNKGISRLQHCTGVQEIEIKRIPGNQKVITIDGRQLGLAEHLLLAKNDGFDDVNWFYRWFEEDFTGKLIHWTDYRY